MLGGVSNKSTSAGPPSPASHRSPELAKDLTLLVSTLLGLGLGFVVTYGWWGHPPLPLDVLRDSFQVAAGALFLGAGLVHFSVWWIGGDQVPGHATQGHAGAALVVWGVLAPWITGVGRLIHEDATAAALSPVTAAMAALLALGLGAVNPATSTWVKGHRWIAAMLGAFLLLVLLTAPVIVHELFPASLDLGRTQHFALELSIAGSWGAAAIASELRRRRSGVELAGVGLVVLVTMAVVWLFRAMAVVDLTPWSLAAAALMAATGLVVLSASVRHLSAFTEAGEERTSSAEEALATVAEAFSALDAHRQSVTHDARNVILALSAASQTLVHHGDELDAGVRRRLRLAIAEEVTHLGQLIEPTPVAEVVAFDPCAVVSNVAELERLNGVEVTLDLDPCAALGRPEELTRVVRNLVVNVQQHAAGSPVRIQVRDAGAFVRMLVEDDGPGIPAELRHAVFGRGVVGVGSGGTGLGLHVSKALMRQQGGTLELADTSRGTCFVLTLPRTPGLPGAAAHLPRPRAVGVSA